jgi:hypothetical protein
MQLAGFGNVSKLGNIKARLGSASNLGMLKFGLGNVSEMGMLVEGIVSFFAIMEVIHVVNVETH